MKLTIPRKEFMTALATVRPVAGGSLPILNTVLIDAQAKGVTLTCSNLDLHLRLQTEASVETPGRATIRAALLWDAIRLADGVDVTLTLKKHQLKIECGQTRHEVVTLPPEDFPPFPAIGSASPGATSPAPRAFFVEDAAFRNLLAETTFACSKETERAILTGVALQIVKSPGAGSTTMHVVACNGFMLATNTIAVPDAPEFNAIIPADTARELLRLLSDDAEKPHRLNITASEGHIQFAFANGAAGDLTLHSRLIEGQFPPWQKIVPQDNPTANLSRTELARSIERIAIVGDQVRLAFTPQSLVLTSVGKRGTDFLGDAYDSLLVPANHSVAANFSTKFLLQILSAIPDGAVELHINAEGASLFKTPGRDWRAVLIAIPEAKEKVEAPAKDKAPATKAPSPEPKAPEQTETPGAKTPAGTDKLKSKKK